MTVSKTIALRRELQRYLETVASNVYYEEAADKKQYPYVVFELSEISNISGKTLLQLEINVVGYGASSDQVERLSDSIQSIFHRYYFINHEIEFAVYKNRRDTIKEEDKKIIRRRILFEVHLHELKGE